MTLRQFSRKWISLAFLLISWHPVLSQDIIPAQPDSTVTEEKIPAEMPGADHPATAPRTPDANAVSPLTIEPPPSSSPGTVLTWADCVRLAADHNPDLEASRNEVLNADAIRKASYANLYPQISASLGGGRSYREVKNPGMPSGSDYSNNFSAQLSLTQTIFDGLRTQGNIDAAKAGLAYSYAALNSQKAATSYALKGAFAQLLYAQTLVANKEQVLRMRTNTERMLGLFYTRGRENKGNWLISLANREQANFDYQQALRNRAVSEQQLLTILGKLDLPAPLWLEGELVTGELPVKPDFAQLALQTPAYLQRVARADAARAGVRIAESGWWPTIGASVSGGQSGDSFFPNTAYAGGSVSVSYPLFSGGQTYFNVAATQASLRQTLAELRGGTNQASLTLAQAYKSLVDAKDNVKVQQLQLQAQGLRQTISEAQYRNGFIAFNVYNDNTNASVEQQTRYIAALRDAVIAEANWEQARGLGAIP